MKKFGNYLNWGEGFGGRSCWKVGVLYADLVEDRDAGLTLPPNKCSSKVYASQCYA